MNEELVKRLREYAKDWRDRAASADICHEAADTIEALTARIAQLEAERDSLAGIVQGWHYLAVGPDEMGDYYTHKQLVKLSEPYASPSLRALKDTYHD